MENVVKRVENGQGPVSKDEIKKRVEGLIGISTIPEVINRIMDLTGNPNTVNNELAKVIERDQAIAMRVVAASNSAFYGFSKKITTISQAILVLGFDMVRGLALTTTVFSSVPAGQRHQIKKLWTHSFAAAQAASLIAKKTGAVERESAFLSGLFHDIGRAVLAQVCAGVREADPFDRNSLSKEEQAFGATHAEVGAWLAERFKLPEAAVAAIRYHHSPERCPSPAPALVSIAYLANLAAAGGPNSVVSPEHESIVCSLGISPEDMAEIVSEVSEIKTDTSFYE